MGRPDGVKLDHVTDDEHRVTTASVVDARDAELALLEAQYQEARAALPPEYQKWLDETAGTIHVDSPFDAADLPYPE